MPTENEISIENAHVNENPPAHNEEIEEDIEDGDVDELGQEKEVPAETIIVLTLDPMLA